MPSRIYIGVTLIIALIFSLLPMPSGYAWLKPAWVLMALIYWAMMMPHWVNIGTAWVMGIAMDLLNHTLLGEHALAFTVVIYCVVRMHTRLRLFPMLQQGLYVLILILFYQFIIYCIQGFIGELPRTTLYWLTSVTSILFWPWLVILLRESRHWVKA